MELPYHMYHPRTELDAAADALDGEDIACAPNHWFVGVPSPWTVFFLCVCWSSMIGWKFMFVFRKSVSLHTY